MITARQTITPTTDSLEKLIDGCRQQQLKSQEQLYRYCYEQMIGTCYRYAGDMDGAGIIFNNAMLRVFRYIAKYKHENKWIAWIRTIVVHCCLDHIKQRHRFREEKLTSEHEDIVDIAEELWQKISTKEVHACIHELPKATAAVFNLFIYEGYTHREIAELLSISEGTSKWHVNEGRKQLKKKLETLYNSYEE